MICQFFHAGVKGKPREFSQQGVLLCPEARGIFPLLFANAPSMPEKRLAPFRLTGSDLGAREGFPRHRGAGGRRCVRRWGGLPEGKLGARAGQRPGQSDADPARGDAQVERPPRSEHARPVARREPPYLQPRRRVGARKHLHRPRNHAGKTPGKTPGALPVPFRAFWRSAAAQRGARLGDLPVIRCKRVRKCSP